MSLAYRLPISLTPSQNANVASFLRIVIFVAIAASACSSRLFSVIRHESVIHEFDPWFNYRATKLLVEKGFVAFWNWFDSTAWYPLGRVVGGTLYPGLMLTSGLIHSVLHSLNIPIDIRNICVMLAPAFSGLTAYVTYKLTTEIKDERAGLLAAAFIGLAPGYTSRSVAGSYDNEAIAIFLLMFTFYLWIKALKTGSVLRGVATALSYYYMVSAWGGYAFIINLIPLHVFVLLLMGRYSSKLYASYSAFYTVGTITSMQVPFVGFLPLRTSDHMAALGVFGLMQLVALSQLARTYLPSKQFKVFMTSSVIALAVAAFSALVLLTMNGLIAPWTGRFYSLWDTGYAKIHIPIIASVSEHQPTAWPSFFFDLNMLIYLFPAGVFLCFRELRDEHVFIIIYSVFNSYFAGVMVRLMLTLTPVVCIASAVALSTLLDTYINPVVQQNVLPSPLQNQVDQSKASKKAKGGSASASYTASTSQAFSYKGIFNLDSRLLVVANVSFMLAMFVHHSIWVTSVAYSSPSIVLASRAPDGSQNIIDDFREAYFWLSQNTKPDAVVASWWDYGYQIAGMANRTTLVDNNTWSNGHIATVGRAMSSPEDLAYPILRAHDVDYVLVIFGGLIGYSGDDINKFLWMIRIAQGEWPDGPIQERNFFSPRGEYKVDHDASPAMRESLMYKMSYYRFAELYQGQQPIDRVRSVRLPTEGPTLDILDEAFTSENWLVRIYQVKKEDILGRSLKAANAFDAGKRLKKSGVRQAAAKKKNARA